MREEGELWFLQRLMSMHTKLPCYKYGLWDSKGKVATWKEEVLAGIAVMATFL